MSRPADEDLLASAVQGDHTALRSLLQDEGPAVRKAIAPRIPRRWQSVLSADDVMQQTYADTVQNLARFTLKGDGSFRAWLLTLARCNLQDAVRRLEAQKRGGDRHRVDRVADGDSFVTLLRVLDADTTTPSRHVARREIEESMERAIRRLPEVYGIVVRACDLEGKDVAEVAEALGRSVGATHMLRARAHDRLREMLGAASQFFSKSS